MSRIVCLFSCGAASAVATKLAISEAQGQEVVIFRTYLEEEHADNARFQADCERWFGLPVIVVTVPKYNSSIYEVFRIERFIKGPGGAACTRRLKREPRELYVRHDDTLIFGYDADEQDRLDAFIDANNGVTVRAPLIEHGLTKDDCLGMLWKNGIAIPAMYELGYRNNNCIGCVKGGKGYWNKIRRDFPEAFERMAKEQDRLGPGSYFWPGDDGNRISLRELPTDAGNYMNEPEIQCGIACELVNIQIAATETTEIETQGNKEGERP